MHDKLRRYGYRYINIDAGWSDHLDTCAGRNAWDTARFPDGIPALAAYLHRLGLKFGIYLTPGIPIEAYQKNLPVQGTRYHMQDIVDPSQPGNTHNDSYRIDFSKPGAAEYVQGYADLFASWGVDYIKMDFVGPGGGKSFPPTTAPRCGRGTRRSSPPVVRCTWSSNSLSIADAATWQATSNGWRTGGDIEHARRQRIQYPVDQLAADVGPVRPGRGLATLRWLRRVQRLRLDRGRQRQRRRADPRRAQTQLSLWSLASSPLLLGTDLTRLDAADLRLLANRDVIAVDQDTVNASWVSKSATAQVFAKTEPNGGVILGLFNTGSVAQTVSIAADTAGLPASSRTASTTCGRTRSPGPPAPPSPLRSPCTARRCSGVRPWAAGTASGRPQTGLTVTAPGILGTGQQATADADFTNWGTVVATGVHVALPRSRRAGRPPSLAHLLRLRRARRERPRHLPCHAADLHHPDLPDGPARRRRPLPLEYRHRGAGHWLGRRAHVRSARRARSGSVPHLFLLAGAPRTSHRSAPRSAFARPARASTDRRTNTARLYVPGAGTRRLCHDGSCHRAAVPELRAKTGIMVRNDITGASDSPGFLTRGVSAKKGYFMQWDADGDRAARRRHRTQRLRRRQARPAQLDPAGPLRHHLHRLLLHRRHQLDPP
ncbi:glycoside hydrolase family 27 protein [Streptomyces sp. L7]